MLTIRRIARKRWARRVQRRAELPADTLSGDAGIGTAAILVYSSSIMSSLRSHSLSFFTASHGRGLLLALRLLP